VNSEELGSLEKGTIKEKNLSEARVRKSELMFRFVKEVCFRPGVVVRTCNPSYLGGTDRRTAIRGWSRQSL
jgi:hypothetical protein